MNRNVCAMASFWSRKRRLLGVALANPEGWTVIVPATLGSTGFAVLQPWPMKILIDHVLGTEPMPRWLADASQWLPFAGTPRGLLAWVVVAFFGIFLINSAMDVILTFAWIQ